MLKNGEKIHIIHRQLFEKDVKRHFVGEVENYQDGFVRVTGYMFSVGSGQGFTRRQNKQIRVIALCGQTLVNVLPPEVEIEKIVYESARGCLRLSDGSDWHMDISYA